jgi:hypothetical protein
MSSHNLGRNDQEQKLIASDAADHDYFGLSAAVSGNTAVIGACRKDSEAGAIYVYQALGLDHLEIETQPASTGSVDSPLTTSAVVTAYNVIGQPLSGINVTASLETGKGILRGNLTVTTNAQGQATFQ